MGKPRNDAEPGQDAFGKPPIVQQIDISVLNATLAAFKQSIDDALRRISDIERWQFVDQTARDSLTLLTATVTAMNTRLTTAEMTIANIPSTYSLLTHDHASLYSVLSHDHASLYSVLAHTHVYSTLTSIPSTFTPADHNNTAHTPDYSDTTHTHSWTSITSKPTTFDPNTHGDSAHTALAYATSSAFSGHTHPYSDADTSFFPSYGTNDPHTHSLVGGDNSRTTGTPS